MLTVEAERMACRWMLAGAVAGLVLGLLMGGLTR